MRGWFWRPSYKAVIQPHQILEYSKIMCVSYKWEGENKVHHLKWDRNKNDKTLVEKFAKILESADECIAHNIDKFDDKVFRTRCIFHGVPLHYKFQTFDTLKKARTFFSFPSNKLDELGKFLGVGRKIENESGLWQKVIEDNDRKALDRMVAYCDQDVILLEDVYLKLRPYVSNNHHLAALDGGEKSDCPTCGDYNVYLHRDKVTKSGTIRRVMKCNGCKCSFEVSNRVFLDSLKIK